MSPLLGRFATPDPLGAFGDPMNLGNPYTYVGNNPWSYMDPYGLDGSMARLFDDPDIDFSAVNQGKLSAYMAREANSRYKYDPNGDVLNGSFGQALPPRRIPIAGAGAIAAGPFVALAAGVEAGNAAFDLQQGNYRQTMLNMCPAALAQLRIINKAFAGQTKPLSEALAKKYKVPGVQFTDEGFPDFTPFMKDKQDIGEFVDYSSDFAKANTQAGFPKTPNDYTWHHVEDGRTMLLVPRDVHREVAHTGGMADMRNGGLE